MEVHHHAHTARKKWTHYFWEFLMLFLAVTLGFFVENEREHYIEHRREKRFMESMVEDLEKDIRLLKSESEIVVNQFNGLDTLVQLINEGNLGQQQVRKMYALQRKFLFPTTLELVNRTESQLKNAGGMRLIRNRQVNDSIVNYWQLKERLIDTKEAINGHRIKAKDLSFSLFDNKFYAIEETDFTFEKFVGEPTLMSHNPSTLIEFANRVSHMKDLLLYNYKQRRIVNLTGAAANLIQVIKKEYHLQ